MKQQKVVGENANQRMIRLLKRFNERFCDPDCEEMIAIHLNTQATGELLLLNNDDDVMYTTANPEQMIGFLEQSVGVQVASMIRQASAFQFVE